MSGIPSNIEEQWAGALARLQRAYPWHRGFFLAFNALLTLTNIATGPPWWGLWPLLITGFVFAVHYLIYKASIIDDAWVDERAADLYYKSYDQGHIDTIASHNDMEKVTDRIIKGDAARRPPRPPERE